MQTYSNPKINIEKELQSLKRSHSPSYARGLIRLAKNVLNDKEKLDSIILEAIKIKDPYYAAFALAACAREMQKSNVAGYAKVFDTALKLVKMIEPDWRKVEILDIVITKMGQTGISDYDGVLKIFESIDNEELRTNIARKIIREMIKTRSSNYSNLFQMAKTEKEKVELIKITANEIHRNGGTTLEELDDDIKDLNNINAQIKAWAYLGLKSEKIKENSGEKYFELALDRVKQVNIDEERLELLKYISDNLLNSGKTNISNILELRQTFKDRSLEAKLLGHIAGRMMNIDKEKGFELFETALNVLEEVDDIQKKIHVMLNLGKGLSKAGSDNANEVLQKAEILANDLPENESYIIKNRINMILKPTIQTKDEPKTQIIKGSDALKVSTIKTEFNPILALYNTYEKKLGQAHIRSIARAAPLCWAYDLDLGIFNFPIKDKKDLITEVIQDTSVGRGGSYLKNLDESSRIFIQPDIRSKDLGKIIATTSHPNQNKIITIKDIVNLKGRNCFLLGLGKLGLSKDILDHADYHLEFTQKGIPLETCSAMGILAHILGHMKRN